MSANSSIEWTDATWNPIRARNKKTGKLGWFCVHASEGCRHCFSARQNVKAGDSGGNGIPYRAQDLRLVDIFLDEKVLTKPLHWRAARKIFVCSMTDLFADFVPDEWIDKMFAVMALCPQHTFQILTKRAERMQQYINVVLEWECINDGYEACQRWPLPNVWLGVSCERQEEADARIPLLLQTPAAVRFISAEPLLGPIDLEAMPFADGDPRHRWSALTGQALMYATGVNGNPDLTVRMEKPLRNKLDWIIAGGESGSQARPMSIQWARELRDQCSAAGVKFFFKQWGEWAPAGSHRSGDPGRFAFGDYEYDRTRFMQVDSYPRQFTKFGARSTLARVGKKAAGRLLDGREWNEFPAVQP